MKNFESEMNKKLFKNTPAQLWVSLLLLLLTFFAGLFIQGAIPFVSMTTLPQAIAVIGYPISFINEGGALYATNMGYPTDAAMSTMLAPALVMQAFLSIDISPANAFTFAFIVWFSIGYIGAYKLARLYLIRAEHAALLSLLWFSFPIVWNSAGYTHLHFGFVLLPFLLYASIRVLRFSSEIDKKYFSISLYPFSACLAVFTDGYTFMLFAVSSSLFLVLQYIEHKNHRQKILGFLLPLHVVSFAAAYFLFASYIGRGQYEAAPIDFFRGWGLDLTFIGIPSKGVHWVWDVLGLSVPRSDKEYFGDASVWISTFSLPIIILGIYSYFISRKAFPLSRSMFLLAILGFYMALGPSIKFNSIKPHEPSMREIGPLMSAEYAGPPTGNAIISESLPGFKSMRASYRWIALGYLGMWGLVLGYLVTRRKQPPLRDAIIIIVVITTFLPNLGSHFKVKQHNYHSFQQIDDVLLNLLKNNISPDEVVAFLPLGNDFIVNYLAPRLRVKAYNIGGDKNVDAAQAHWPPAMRALRDELGADKILPATKVLIDGNADVLIIPYFDMLWAAHSWPGTDLTNKLEPFVSALKSLPYLEVTETSLFATVRLRAEFTNAESRSALTSTILGSIEYPISLGSVGSELKDISYSHIMLRDGWYAPEAHHVWSQGSATLTLPVPKTCDARHCEAILKFTAFGSSQQRPVTLVFDSQDQNSQWNEKIVASSEALIEIRVPLVDSAVERNISITVPAATSPQALTGSLDNRILGIALQKIELVIK